SPCDQLRIFSGEARLIRIESKSAIKLALSYGEERYMNDSLIYLSPNPQNVRGGSLSAASPPVFHAYCAPPNRRRAPYPAARAVSSSIPRRGTGSAVRELIH